MRKIILRYDKEIPDKEFNELFQSALNYGIFDIMVDEKYSGKIGKLDRIKSYSNNLDDSPNFYIIENPSNEELKAAIEESISSKYLVGAQFEMTNKEDEQKIIKIARQYPDLSFLMVKATDWTVIPFENLIAELSNEDILLYADVESLKDAELLFDTLEKGVDGVFFRPKDSNEILDLKTMVGGSSRINLTKAVVQSIKEIPKADRVCVDTTSMLREGEGMLVGSTAKGFALVHAEVFHTEFVNSRPFRVNAGDVSAYILVPSFNEQGELKTRTNYLSELQAGENVIVSDVNGNLRIVTVGRAKIETRPMLLFNLIADYEGKQIPINLILQNAETIRAVKADKSPISVVDIKEGDELIVHIGPGATHFGTAIKETIIEK